MDIRATDSTNSAIRNKTITTAYNGIAPFSRQPNKVFTRRERERERERETLVKRGVEYLRRLGLRLTAMAKTTSRWGLVNVRTRGGRGKCIESANESCPYSFACQ